MNCFKLSSEEDVLRYIKANVDTTRNFDLLVTRDSMAERGLKLWNRRKNNGGPENQLKVSFLGEKGIDTGALSKEFLCSEFLLILPIRVIRVYNLEGFFCVFY